MASPVGSFPFEEKGNKQTIKTEVRKIALCSIVSFSFPFIAMTFLRAGDWTSNQVWNLVHADFIVKSMIGTGSDGVVVFEAIHRDSEEEVALKFIPVKSKYHRERALKELRLLEKVLHENVVWAYGMILGLELGVLVLERCKTDFFELLSAASQPFPEQKALIIFKQMLNAVIHCHRVGIAHRDIKLENFFLSNSGQVRLGDFGLAEPYQPDQVFMNSVGTPGYAAPEVIRAIKMRCIIMSLPAIL